MSAAEREAQWIRRRTVWAGQATLVQYSSRLLPCSVSGCAHDGHSRRRHDLALGARALGRVEHAGHERDHVAGAAHQHGVADPHVARADHLLVGERRAGHRRAADEHRLQHRDRRDLADLADVPDDVGEQRRLLLGRELEGERAARAVRARARPPRRRRGRRAAARRRRGRSRARCAAPRSPRSPPAPRSASSQWRMSAASKPSVAQRLLEVGVGAVRRRRGRTRRSAAAARRPSAGSLARIVPAAALRGLISGLSGCAAL